MTDTNTSGAKCAHNWHDSSDKPGTVWCNRCGMVSAAGSEGVPRVETSGTDVLALLDRCAEIMHDDAAPAMQDADIAADLRDGAVDLIAARAAVAALIEREAALVAEVEELRADAERLGWLDAQNISKRMGWKVNVAPLGNVSVQSVIFLGSEPVKIRDAIDAARAEARNG